MICVVVNVPSSNFAITLHFIVNKLFIKTKLSIFWEKKGAVAKGGKRKSTGTPKATARNTKKSKKEESEEESEEDEEGEGVHLNETCY